MYGYRLNTNAESELNGYETGETSSKWGTYAMDCCIAGSSLIAVTRSTYVMCMLHLCVKMALICKNRVKVRVRLGLGLGSGLGLGLGSGLGIGLAFHRCTDKGHIFTDKG